MSYTMISAIFHILGIFLAGYTDLSGVIIFSIIGIIVALTRKRANITLALAFFMFTLGTVSYNVAAENRLYNAYPDKYVTITGTITSVPTVSSGEYKFKYILDADELSYLDKSEKINELLYIRTKSFYQYGDVVTLSGFLTELRGGDNQYDTDYSRSFKSKGIYNQITAYEITKADYSNSLSPRYFLGNLKSRIFDTIYSRYAGDTAALYNAILLGDKSHLSDNFTTKLLRTGLWQALYSPYIHITLLCLIVGIFQTSTKKNRALLVLLLLYALFNTGNPNILKASLLIASVLICQLVLGYSNKMQQLAALVLAMTIINPMLCYNRGFILSVASTIILYVFYPAVSGALYKKRIRRNKVLSVISIFITLTLFSFPLSAYLFNGISIYSTIITTLLIPVILLILLSSTVHIPVLYMSASFPALDKFVTHLLEFIRKLPEYIEKIPFHYISSRTPTILEIVTAYFILWLIAQLISGRKRDDIFKAVSAITLSLMFSCTLFSQHPGLEVYFVNVGQGDAAILHTSKNETILIDGGGAAEYTKSDYNVGDRILVPYLVSHGLTNIDYAIVTHFHKDHVEGIISAVKNLRVKNIVMPYSTPDSDYRAELEHLAKKKNIDIIYAEKDGMISLKSGLTLNILSPDSMQKQSDEPNDTAIVIEAKYYEFSGLFTSDSTDIIDSSYPQNIDLLKVAHHGSDSGSSKSDIDYLRPKYAVISVGKDNSYALPDDIVLNNLENVGARILRTDILGDIRFKIQKNGKISYKSLRKE